MVSDSIYSTQSSGIARGEADKATVSADVFRLPPAVRSNLMEAFVKNATCYAVLSIENMLSLMHGLILGNHPSHDMAKIFWP